MAFARLTIILGNAVTFKRGKSPYLEVYGHSFRGIVNVAKRMLPIGWVLSVLPPECWGDLSQRHYLLNGMNAEGKKGILQIQFANAYRAILRQ